MQRQLIPARALPPGKILQKELEARTWTKETLTAIDKDFSQIIFEIIQGKQHITPEIAEKLAQVFDTTAESWMKLENNYRLYLAKKAVDSVPNTSDS
jgi:plasmid maintenance system antidote protein VapI